ncbi:MAG TPA: serine hydrolase domain-containing protein [Verrucomicrobiae bacterium]
MNYAIRAGCFTILLSAFPFHVGAEDFTNAVHAFLQRRIEVEKRDVGLVVGIVDEHGSSIVNYGKLDNGTDQEVNGDTLFDLASVTKTFTGLLLQDMVERGEMKLDDPVTKYLPESVKMPTRNGKEITLLQLATHTSGLPLLPDNAGPKSRLPTADYTFEKLDAFVSGYKLTREPGTKYEYSNVGIALLGQAIALKAGTNYESLVVDRICRPLEMDSTRFTLTPELKSRFATGHNQLGHVVSSWDWGALMAAAALRSTANDMLKYVSANLGLMPSSLTPLMEKTHAAHFHTDVIDEDVGLGWFITRELDGTKIVWKTGSGPGYTAFAGFDMTQRRGIVVMSSSEDEDVHTIGRLLLESEWQPDRRPKETKINSQLYDSCGGQYQLTPDFTLGILTLRQYLFNAPKAVIYIPVSFCLAVLLVFLWRTASFRKRCIILGGAVLVSGLLVALIALVLSHMVCAFFHPGISIRCEGNRAFAQYTLAVYRQRSPITSKLLPPFPAEFWPEIPVELLPESETHFFNRLTGMPVTFFRDNRGKVTRLTAQIPGAEFSLAKISDQHVAIKLNTKLLDVCAGQYEFAPDKMILYERNLKIWRQGDQLVVQVSDQPGKPGSGGTFDIYPESETNFFLKIADEQFIFIKNGKGEVTAVTVHHPAGLPDTKGKKLAN